MSGPRVRGEQIALKSKSELERMRHAGRIHARTIARLREAIRPGVTSAELDELAEASIREAGGAPSFKGYQGFPATICAQLNDVVVHGIPSEDEVLEEGDIFGADLGVIWEGYHADGAFTVGVGEIDPESARLIEVTREALELAFEQVLPGKTIRDIAAAVQGHVEAAGFSIVRALVGHGIGSQMHEPPQVPNFVDGGRGNSYDVILRPGMTLAIEPMVNAGGYDVKQDADGWKVRTRDGSRSAHFEHTVAVTEDGCWILTAP
ncbi:MAG: type I methionyl aminopeptidase [candidate division WS1 bacterium]|jgi:methionyl aminopeptidase|nr:type I methionyl aminopeptidase [candidate division WS1 bacterium]